jgi:nicotinate-nucleotide--dimethylbenzimidazole phosphoribosyltransferase
MAPNNALADRDNKKPKPNGKQGATTVLDKGTVESRGMGTKATSRNVISAEIQAFLSGEAKFGWLSETRAFFTVWTFITRLPGPTWVDHHPGYLMRGMAYFPVGGALVGVLVGVFFDLAAAIGMPSAVAAAVSTAASFWVTGCFHEDGLADASDGIGGGWSRAQILRIMTDTRLGTYGCAVLLLYIVAKLELLAALGYSHWDPDGSVGAGPALLASHTLARLSSPYLIKTRDYVDEAGPKYKFYSFMVQAKHLVTWYRVVFATVFSFGLATLLYGASAAAVLVSGVFFLSHTAGEYGEYILGGVMGDFLGATICVTELLVLSLILILQKTDIPELFATLVVELKDTESLMEKLDALWEEERFFAVFRWFSVMFVTVIWCSTVGHPSVLVRDTVVLAAEQGDDEIRIKLTTTPEERTNGVESHAIETPRTKADKVCSSPSSTFEERYNAVQVFLDSLAKPVGSLGTLEDWAARLAALQRTTRPNADSVVCLIFASDHGVAASPQDGGEGCSAYPQAVTRSVLDGLERGVAGASVLAKANGVSLQVVDVGVNGQVSSGNVVVVSDAKLLNGTRNLCLQPAMTAEESEACIRAGRTALIQHASEMGAQAVVLGEVGIGNTTSSSALIAALTGEPVETLCGGGAFLSQKVDETAIAKKITIVKKSLALHGSSVKNPASALAKLGGAEIASLVGAILEASHRDIPVLVDGFIVTVAALVAASLSPNVCLVLFLTSKSAEKGQTAAIDKISRIAKENSISMHETPVLSMNMRMGEATAALLAVPILRSAAAVLSDMATIQEILEPSC